jgi:thymidylate synthase
MATTAWLSWLFDIRKHGALRSPRGLATFEVPHLSTSFPMHYPIVHVPERRLSKGFLCAEALWILRGDDRVGTIAPYNPNIAAFSDDGVTFAGAYGPRFVNQVRYVANAIVSDNDTRQAVLTLWNRRPRPSKDIPCTVSMQFVLRSGYLDAHAYMRSSDAWLGVPYDWFNFTMMALRVAHLVNSITNVTTVHDLGRLYFTAACAHFYRKDLARIDACLTARLSAPEQDLSGWVVREGDPAFVERALEAGRDERRWPRFGQIESNI